MAYFFLNDKERLLFKMIMMIINNFIIEKKNVCMYFIKYFFLISSFDHWIVFLSVFFFFLKWLDNVKSMELKAEKWNKLFLI